MVRNLIRPTVQLPAIVEKNAKIYGGSYQCHGELSVAKNVV
jgi:hypothetical protein